MTLCDGDAVPPRWLRRRPVAFARHQKCKKAPRFDHRVAAGWTGEVSLGEGGGHVTPAHPPSLRRCPIWPPPRTSSICMAPPERQPPRPLVSGTDPVPRAHPPGPPTSPPDFQLLNLVCPPTLFENCEQCCLQNVVFLGCVCVWVKLFALLNSADTVSKRWIMSRRRRDVSILLIRSWKPDIHIQKAVLGAAAEGQ